MTLEMCYHYLNTLNRGLQIPDMKNTLSQGPNIFKHWDQLGKRKESWTISSANVQSQDFKSLRQRNLARKASAARSNRPPPLQCSSRTKEATGTATNKISPVQPGSDVKVDEGLLTCWFWANKSFCHFGNQCVFEHRLTSRTALEYNTFANGQVTCWYWYDGDRCSKPTTGPAACTFAHHVTPYLMSNERRLQRFPSQKNSTFKSSTAADLTTSEESALPYQEREGPLPGELVGCYFYNTTGCFKPADKCPFAHEITRYCFNPKTKQPVYNPNGGVYKRHIARNTTVDNLQNGNEKKHFVEDSPEPSPRTAVSHDRSPLGALFSYKASEKTSSVAQNPPSNFPTDIRGVQLTIHVHPNGQEENAVWFQCLLAGRTDEEVAKVLARFNPQDSLSFDTVCTNDDAQNMVDWSVYQTYAEGDILDMSISSHASSHAYEKVANTLASMSAAAITYYNGLSLFIFPSKGEWTQMFRPSHRPHEKSLICFRLVDALPQPPETNGQASEGANETPKTLCANEDILSSSIYSELPIAPYFETPSSPAKKVAFIIFHDNFQQTVNQLTARLLEAQVEVFHSNVPGSWAHFRKHYCQPAGGLVLVHGDISTRRAFEQTPFLQDFLSQGKFNFYRFSERKENVLEAPRSDLLSTRLLSSTHPQFCRIFPHGQAVFIMDDCLADQPSDTLPVLQLLYRRAKEAKTPTYIIGRPGLIQWAWELAKRHEGDEEDMGISDRESIRAKIFKILFTLKEEPSKNGRGLCHVVSPEVEGMPTYGPLWERDEVAAMHWMAEWYAVWALERLEDVRQFFVVALAKSSVRDEWSKKYKHLAVLTPSQWCSREERKQSQKDAPRRGA